MVHPSERLSNKYFRNLLENLEPVRTAMYPNSYLVCQKDQTFYLEENTQNLISKIWRCVKTKFGVSYDLRRNLTEITRSITVKLKEAKESQNLPRVQRHVLADELLAARKVYKILFSRFATSLSYDQSIALQCLQAAATLKEMPPSLLACRLGEIALAHSILQKTEDSALYKECLEFRDRLLQTNSLDVQVGLKLLKLTPDLSKEEIPDRERWIIAALNNSEENVCCQLVKTLSLDDIKYLEDAYSQELDDKLLLEVAVQKGYLQLVTLLLDKGHPADFLSLALSKNNLAIAEILVIHKAPCTENDQQEITRLRRTELARMVYTLPDHTLVVGTERIDVNKAIIARLCPVLDTMWKSSMKEGTDTSNETLLPDDNPAAVRDCISYLAGNLPLEQEQDINRLLDLLHQAEKLRFEGIGKAVCTRLISLFSEVDIETLGDEGFQALDNFREHLEKYEYLVIQDDLQQLLRQKIGDIFTNYIAMDEDNFNSSMLVPMLKRSNSFVEKLIKHNLVKIGIPDHIVLGMRYCLFLAQRNQVNEALRELEVFFDYGLQFTPYSPSLSYGFGAFYGLRRLNKSLFKHAKDHFEGLLKVNSNHEKGICAYAELLLSGGCEDAPDPQQAKALLDAFTAKNSSSDLVNLVQAHILRKMGNPTPAEVAKIKELVMQIEVYEILDLDLGISLLPQPKLLQMLIRNYLLEEDTPPVNPSEVLSKIEKHFITPEPIDDKPANENPFILTVLEPALYSIVEDAAISFYKKYSTQKIA